MPLRLSGLLLALLGCGTAAGVPGGDSPPPAPGGPTGASGGGGGSAAAPAPAPASPTQPGDGIPPPAATGCQPSAFVASPNATNTQFRSLALDGGSLAFLEWVTYQASTMTNDGEYLSVADLATAAKTRLAHFVGGAQAFTFDATAYWVTLWGNAAATGDGLGSVVRVDRASAATTTLASGLSLEWSLAGTTDTLYFSNRTADHKAVELDALAKSSGAQSVVATALADEAKILADADGVAWTEQADVAGVVRLVHFAGGVTTELARGDLVTTALARHGDSLYFADRTGVLSVPLAGGAPPTRIATAPRVLEVLADDHGVAWLQGPSRGGDLQVNDDAVLVAMPTGGGGAVTAARVHAPHDLVADATSFYWVDDQTTIDRVCRPF